MSTPTTITIDDTEYVRSDSVIAGDPTDMRIVVADRGWVFVGIADEDDHGNITISGAKNIRYWGTSNDKPGLGWLAMNGPTGKTKLDPSGTVRIPASSVVASFDVNEKAWA